jgi:hypothetical protein
MLMNVIPNSPFNKGQEGDMKNTLITRMQTDTEALRRASSSPRKNTLQHSFLHSFFFIEVDWELGVTYVCNFWRGLSYCLFYLVGRRRGSDDTGKLVASVPTVGVLPTEAPSVEKGLGSGVMSSVGANVTTSGVTGAGVSGIGVAGAGV